MSVRENADRAWAAALATIRAQNERQLRLGLRHSFGLKEIEGVFYLDRYPRLPLVEIGEELICFEGRSLGLAERCLECGEEVQIRKFVSLSDLGEQIALTEAAEPFICRECRVKALSKKK